MSTQPPSPDAAPAPPPRSSTSIAARIGIFIALTLLLVRERSGEVGLWDWDTYGRFLFIHDYHPDIWVDGHVLYHSLMRVPMALGLSAPHAAILVTALGGAAFLTLLHWICEREGLSRAATWIVLAAATLGSPGLVALFGMAEDNVLYFPVVLGAFYLLYLQHPTRRVAVRRGVALGLLMAAAMLINISLLVMVFALAAAIVIGPWLRDRDRALGLAAAFATTIAAYYVAHVFPFTGAKVALHEFLPQALGLRDFEQSTSPLFSLERFALYRGGLRAIALTPNFHLMRLPPGLQTLVLTILPALLTACAVTLGVWLVRFRASALRAAFRTRLDLLGLFAIAIVFPYFYEPFIVERWDLFWLGLVFALVPFFKLRPSPFARGLVVAMLALQGVGTVITVAHHYGVAFADPALREARATASRVVERNLGPVVLSTSIDRPILADLIFRIGPRTVYLCGEARDQVTCFVVVQLREHPVPVDEVRQALRVPSGYVDPRVSPRARTALGLPP